MGSGDEVVYTAAICCSLFTTEELFHQTYKQAPTCMTMAVRRNLHGVQRHASTDQLLKSVSIEPCACQSLPLHTPST